MLVRSRSVREKVLNYRWSNRFRLVAPPEAQPI
jgi:hypothetical protein